VQYFRECWAGELSSEFFNKTAKAEGCWGVRPNFRECLDHTDTKCVGNEYLNYIYEIISGRKYLFILQLFPANVLTGFVHNCKMSTQQHLGSHKTSLHVQCTCMVSEKERNIFTGYFFHCMMSSTMISFLATKKKRILAFSLSLYSRQ
jgi:hypothetical protein